MPWRQSLLQQIKLSLSTFLPLTTQQNSSDYQNPYISITTLHAKYPKFDANLYQQQRNRRNCYFSSSDPIQSSYSYETTMNHDDKPLKPFPQIFTMISDNSKELLPMHSTYAATNSYLNPDHKTIDTPTIPMDQYQCPQLNQIPHCSSPCKSSRHSSGSIPSNIISPRTNDQKKMQLITGCSKTPIQTHYLVSESPHTHTTSSYPRNRPLYLWWHLQPSHAKNWTRTAKSQNSTYQRHSPQENWDLLYRPFGNHLTKWIGFISSCFMKTRSFANGKHCHTKGTRVMPSFVRLSAKGGKKQANKSQLSIIIAA